MSVSQNGRWEIAHLERFTTNALYFSLLRNNSTTAGLSPPRFTRDLNSSFYPLFSFCIYYLRCISRSSTSQVRHWSSRLLILNSMQWSYLAGNDCWQCQFKRTDAAITIILTRRGRVIPVTRAVFAWMLFETVYIRHWLAYPWVWSRENKTYTVELLQHSTKYRVRWWKTQVLCIDRERSWKLPVCVRDLLHTFDTHTVRLANSWHREWEEFSWKMGDRRSNHAQKGSTMIENEQWRMTMQVSTPDWQKRFLDTVLCVRSSYCKLKKSISPNSLLV